MRQIRLTVVDAERACSGTVPAGIADAAVAGLSAEPETIDELEDALARFRAPVDGVRPFSDFRDGMDSQAHGGGIAVIDLAARVVASESKQVKPSAAGSIAYHDGKRATRVRLPYCLPDDWLFLDSIGTYGMVKDRRKAERTANPPFDARPVLYGAVPGFIVAQCRAAWRENLENPVPKIHGDWLLTPRADLRDQSPRETLLSKYELINADLESRERQWGLLRAPASCLSESSSAYRFAAFGIHEIVLYYELVRLLITSCWNRLETGESTPEAEEVARLEQIRQEWLGSAQEELSWKSPAHVLECERKRLPLLVPPEEVAIDDDCPLCRMMARENRPTFWHLTGCNMDTDFAFSFFASREEWEAHEAELEEQRTRWDQEQAIEMAEGGKGGRGSNRQGLVIH